MEDGVIFGKQSVETDMLSALTSIAGTRTSYVDEAYWPDLIRNPYYTKVDNRINRIHLAQIINDNTCVYVQGIPFRDVTLAARFH